MYSVAILGKGFRKFKYFLLSFRRSCFLRGAHDTLERKEFFMKRPKVVIIGGGFGGLTLAKALKNTQIDVTLIDKTNHHLFQPLLYEVATASLSPRDIGVPIREILRGADNILVLMGEVINISKEDSFVELGNGEKLDFDWLVVATGARHSYFGHEKWETFAPGLKTIADALKIRDQILSSFEIAERLGDPVQGEKYLTFVVIGAGPTGVEMAGAIAEIAQTTLLKNFRRIDPTASKIYLLEAADFVLPVYPQKLSLKARESLEKLGVTVITGKKVTDINEQGVQLEDRFIASKNVIWAAGNQAPSVLTSLKVPVDRQNRVIVEKDLAIPGCPKIFVIGDSSHAKDDQGRPLPGVAQTAIQEAAYVAKIIQRQIPQDKRKPFKYFDKGSMATIGKSKAVAMMGKCQFSGFIAWIIWCFVHVLYLIGFRNRFFVLMNWLIIFLTGRRGVRLIYRSLDKEIPKPPS